MPLKHRHADTIAAMIDCSICRKMYSAELGRKPGKSHARKTPVTSAEARRAANARWKNK